MINRVQHFQAVQIDKNEVTQNEVKYIFEFLNTISDFLATRHHIYS